MTTDTTIQEQNSDIAVFMGYERYEDSYGTWFKKEGLIKCMHPKLEDLKYHSSWDALMEVVEKIRQKHFVEMYFGRNTGCIIAQNNNPNSPTIAECDSQSDKAIKVIYKTVLDFIVWHYSYLSSVNKEV